MHSVDSPLDPSQYLDLTRSCGEGGVGPAPHALEVSVYTELAGPRQGTLTVFGALGKTLAQTAFDGNATVSVDTAETDLRLVLEVDRGLSLAARVEGYRSGTAVVLSPLSTLVDAYLGAHPGMALAQGQSQVLDSLGLPAGVPIGTLGFSLDRDLFDADRFYQAVAAEGGIAALVQRMGGSANAGDPLHFGHGKAVAPGAAKSPDAAIKELVDGLVGNVTDWAGGKVKGWLMQVCGLNSLMKELGLGEGEDTTAKQLEALTAEIKRLGDEIKKVPRSTAYINRLTALEVLAAFIDEKNKVLVTASGEAPPSNEQLQETFVKPVNESLMLTHLHDNQVGSGADAKGLIRLLLDDHPKFYSGRAGVAYDDILFNAFNQARARQAQALNLKIEAAHAGNPPFLAMAEQLLDAYHVNIKRQRLMYPNGLKPFADGSILDRDTGLMWKSEMFEYDGYQALMDDPSSAGQPWRLPNITELQSLLPGAAVRARLPADAISAAAPQIMRHFGFKPLSFQQDGTTHYRHFADLVQGSRPYKILGPGYIVTRNAYKRRDRTWGEWDYELRTLVMNLYNGDEENIRIKFCRGDGKCYVQYGSSQPPVPWTMPVLYVRKPPVPVDFKVDFHASFKSDADTAQARALVQYSDSEEWKDVTQDAIWSVEGNNASDVHVSNNDGTSGRVQLRSKERTGRAYTIKAELPWYLSDQPGQSGRLEGQAELHGNQSAPLPVLKRVLLSPANQVTKQYPFSYDLTLRGVMSSGATDTPETATWSWTSDDPNVQISPSGRVTVAKAPPSKKQIQIRAKIGAAEGFAYLVLMP